MGPVDLDAQSLQPEVFDIAHDPHGGNHGVEFLRGRALGIFQMRHNLAGAAIQFLYRRLFKDLHPLLDEGLLGKGADFGIFHRQHAVHHLDHRGIGAQRVEEAGEFDPDRARSDDQQLFRHPFGLQRVLVGPDQIAISLQPRQLARTGAGGQDDGGGGQFFHTLVGLHRNAALGGQMRLAHHHGDLVLFHQMANATRQLFRHAARPRHDSIQIIADPVGLQAEFLGAVHEVEHLGRAQQRLGGDTAPVQADAPKMFPLHNGNVLAKLRRTDGGHIAPRTRADHDHIKVSGSHRSPPLESSLPLNYF